MWLRFTIHLRHTKCGALVQRIGRWTPGSGVRPSGSERKIFMGCSESPTHTKEILVLSLKYGGLLIKKAQHHDTKRRKANAKKIYIFPIKVSVVKTRGNFLQIPHCCVLRIPIEGYLKVMAIRWKQISTKTVITCCDRGKAKPAYGL